MLFSLYSLNIVVDSDSQGVEDELRRAFHALSIGGGGCPADDVRLPGVPARNLVRLKASASTHRGPPEPPPEAGEYLRIHGLTIYRAGGSLFIKGGASLFFVKPKDGKGIIHLDAGTPFASVHNMLLVGLFCFLPSHGLFHLHAAGVVGGPKGFLLVGGTGAGKSTMTLGLVARGWQYLSDDALLLGRARGGVAAFSLRRMLYVDGSLGRLFPEIATSLEGPAEGNGSKRMLDAERVYPGCFQGSCRPDFLVFPQIASEPESRLIPMDRPAALVHLMNQSATLLYNDETAREHMAILKDLTIQAPSFRLMAGTDVYGHPTRLGELLGGCWC